MRKNNIRKSSQISFNTSMASMNFAQADNFYERMTPLFGSRKLKKWVESPLVDLNKIQERQDIIESFTRDLLLQDKIEKILKEVYDIERLVVK